ncbi:unnamed protein product [Mucor hiemalis]
MLSLPPGNSSTLSAGRPKLHTFRSSETGRFPTLEKLENSMLPSKSSKITIEPVTFSGEYNSTNSAISNGKKLGSQSDARSIHSIKSTKKKQKNKKHQSTPSETFAKNLSEAVLDVDDSLDDGYVYNNSNGSYNMCPPLFSPPLLSPYEASTNYRSGNDESYFSDHHRQKYRRPGLRSTVSELPARGVKSFYLDCMAMPPKFEKRSSYNNKGHYYSRCHYSSSGEEDEENAPLLYYSSSGKKGRNYKVKLQNTRKIIECKWLAMISILFSILLCSVLLFTASPLKKMEVSSISNVLGTRKQLILDLHIQATNPNSWSIQISHSAFSLFAASHYVPTVNVNNTNYNGTGEKGILPSAKQEYLGTVNHLDDPLLFGPANIFHMRPKLSKSTSQIQIQNPGETNGDAAGNERWSLLIRYPYELTLRGVLKYRIFPSAFNSKVYSARICKVIQVDPGSGTVDEVPLSEQTACEDP